jgi:hypothetical protein
MIELIQRPQQLLKGENIDSFLVQSVNNIFGFNSNYYSTNLRVCVSAETVSFVCFWLLLLHFLGHD